MAYYLRQYGIDTNTDYENLDNSIISESETRDDEVNDCIKLLGNNVIDIPVMYENTHVDSPIDMNNGSPNFLYNETGFLNILNPVNIVAGETQEGFIITKTDNILWGDKYKVSYADILTGFDYLWFNYVVINADTVVISLVDVAIGKGSTFSTYFNNAVHEVKSNTLILFKIAGIESAVHEVKSQSISFTVTYNVEIVNSKHVLYTDMIAVASEIGINSSEHKNNADKIVTT